MLLLHPSVLCSVLVTLLAATPAQAGLPLGGSVGSLVTAVTTPLTTIITSSTAAKATAASKQTLSGLSGYKTFFAFGDSYSAYGVGQNRPLTPPDRTGLIYAGGPTWVEYIGQMTSAGQAGVWNFAEGGATIDASLVNSGLPVVLDFGAQVNVFLQQFTNSTGNTPIAAWDPASTAALIWFGTNDVSLPILTGGTSAALWPSIYASFDQKIATLYNAGMRHFVIPNLAPLQLSPYLQDRAELGIQAQFTPQVLSWNSLFKAHINNVLVNNYPTATFTQVDMYNMLYPVWTSPTKYGYKSDSYCEAYGDEVDVDNAYQTSPDCPYSLDGYAFWNSFHPSSAQHKYIAQQIVTGLNGIITRRDPLRLATDQTVVKNGKVLHWLDPIRGVTHA